MNSHLYAPWWHDYNYHWWNHVAGLSCQDKVVYINNTFKTFFMFSDSWSIFCVFRFMVVLICLIFSVLSTIEEYASFANETLFYMVLSNSFVSIQVFCYSSCGSQLKRHIFKSLICLDYCMIKTTKDCLFVCWRR